jgi:pimeloyl-ACP methyl ester carboxylesterase
MIKAVKHFAPLRQGYFKGLYFEAHGTSGRPVILLHGLGATSYSWRHIVPAISQHARIYVFDLKGHGKSEKPDDLRYSLHDQADLILQFIHHFDLRHLTIIGHSLGGGIALLASIRLIDEGERRLASLVLIDSIAFPQKKPFLFKILRLPKVATLLLSTLPAKLWVWLVLATAYYDKALITRGMINEYSQNLKDRAGMHALIQVANQLIPNDLDALIKRYRDIDVPTLILWGKQDRILTPAIGIMLNTQIFRSTLFIIENCGHIPHEEQPSIAIAQILSFIGSSLEKEHRERTRAANNRDLAHRVRFPK